MPHPNGVEPDARAFHRNDLLVFWKQWTVNQDDGNRTKPTIKVHLKRTVVDTQWDNGLAVLVDSAVTLENCGREWVGATNVQAKQIRPAAIADLNQVTKSTIGDQQCWGASTLQQRVCGDGRTATNIDGPFREWSRSTPSVSTF